MIETEKFYTPVPLKPEQSPNLKRFVEENKNQSPKKADIKGNYLRKIKL